MKADLRFRAHPAGLKVEYDVPAGPAMYISRFPPVEKQDESKVRLDLVPLGLPAPQHPDPHKALQQFTMVLPHEYGARVATYFSRKLTQTPFGEPWIIQERTRLWLPARIYDELFQEEEWNVGVMIVPTEVGLCFSRGALEAAAWRVLASIPPEVLIRTLTAVAFRLDILGPRGEFSLAILREMQPPLEIEARIRGKILSGHPLFDPRCLRWVIREIAAASTEGLLPNSAVLSSEENLIARILFPCLVVDRPPDVHEMLRATWLLHESFYLGSGPNAIREDTSLGLFAAVAFRQQDRRSWMNRFDRWDHMWSIADDHQALPKRKRKRTLSPSDIRAKFESLTGLDYHAWYTGAFVVVAGFWSDVVRGGPHLRKPEALKGLVEGNPLASRFLDLLQEGLVVDLPSFGRRVVEVSERVSPYRGLGSTPKYERPELGWMPFLRFEDGAIAPLGLDLMVDALAAMPARLAGDAVGHESVTTLIGYLFEAYVFDLAHDLEERCYVVGARQMGAGRGKTIQRADVLIVHVNDHLVLEISRKRPHGGIAAGSDEKVRTLCASLHEEADQAEATLPQLGAIAELNGLPEPMSSTYLVVTDINVPYGPPLAAELVRQRPGRNPRFVINIEELETLIDLALVGWGPVGLVRSWQEGGLHRSLSWHLWEQGKITPRQTRFTRLDIEAWLSAVPTEETA